MSVYTSSAAEPAPCDARPLSRSEGSQFVAQDGPNTIRPGGTLVLVVDDESTLREAIEKPSKRSKLSRFAQVTFDFGLRRIGVYRLMFASRAIASAPKGGELHSATMETFGLLLEALEARYPALRGTIRDHGTLKRRPFLRFFACKEDLSLEPPETLLPEAVVSGAEPFLIVGAMAGG